MANLFPPNMPQVVYPAPQLHAEHLQPVHVSGAGTQVPQRPVHSRLQDVEK